MLIIKYLLGIFKKVRICYNLIFLNNLGSDMACFFMNDCGWNLVGNAERLTSKYRDANNNPVDYVPTTPELNQFYRRHSIINGVNLVLMITSIFLIIWGINSLAHPGQFGTSFDASMCLGFGSLGFALTVWKSKSIDGALRKVYAKVGCDKTTAWAILEKYLCCRGA